MVAVYQGLRLRDVCYVHKNGKKFDAAASLKVRNHSPDGFNWGYAGSGPAQLALALLLDCVPQMQAVLLYQDFKAEKVASWGQDHFVCTSVGIRAWAAQKLLDPATAARLKEREDIARELQQLEKGEKE